VEGGREEFDESDASWRSSSATRSSRCVNAVSRSATRASNRSTSTSSEPDPDTRRSSQSLRRLRQRPDHELGSQLNRYGHSYRDDRDQSDVPERGVSGVDHDHTTCLRKFVAAFRAVGASNCSSLMLTSRYTLPAIERQSALLVTDPGAACMSTRCPSDGRMSSTTL
jgi:hypothetical protein